MTAWAGGTAPREPLDHGDDEVVEDLGDRIEEAGDVEKRDGDLPITSMRDPQLEGREVRHRNESSSVARSRCGRPWSSRPRKTPSCVSERRTFRSPGAGAALAAAR